MMHTGRGFFRKSTPYAYRVDMNLPRIYNEYNKKIAYILGGFLVSFLPVYVQGGFHVPLTTQHAFSVNFKYIPA